MVGIAFGKSFFEQGLVFQGEGLRVRRGRPGGVGLGRFLYGHLPDAGESDGPQVLEVQEGILADK